MISKNIFKNGYINLFCPNSNEYLFDYIYALGFKDIDSKNWKPRLVILSVLEYLFRLKIINVYSWPNHPELEKKGMTIKETIETIDKLWSNNATFPDFYGIVMFENQKWYTEALEKKGLTQTTNWEKFIENEIGDLEKFIEDNRPID
ncbi:MAG: hypothetical protein P8K77_00200 [Polaribacter sp.]|nr:hypothetical protein [Polaribacter sp.]